MAAYNFTKGEEVTFLNEAGKATVVEVKGDGTVIVTTEDGFDFPYNASLLVPRFDLQKEKPKEEKAPEPLRELAGKRIGMKVHLVDSEEVGIIQSIQADGTAEVEFENLFTERYPVSKLMAYDKEKQQLIDGTIDSMNLSDIGEDLPWTKGNKSLKERRDQGVWEVDLHIQELIDNSFGMMNHEIVQLQLDHFDVKLNEAIDRGLKKVIFIHGRGEGRLKGAIKQILTRYPNCESLDADYQRYGVGATEVRIKYRPKEEAS